MTNRELKNNIYEEISRVSKAISNPNRLEIIDYLSNGQKCVEDIAIQTGISIANASQHLQILKKERLVISQKRGVQVCYSLASEEVYLAWKSLRDLSLTISPFVRDILNQIRQNNKYDQPFTLDKVKNREDVFFIDVRPDDEFQKDHLPNAVSIPLNELDQRMSEIPKDKLVIAYCRGMFCLIADKAVKKLKIHGYNAKKIEENVSDYHLISEG